MIKKEMLELAPALNMKMGNKKLIYYVNTEVRPDLFNKVELTKEITRSSAGYQIAKEFLAEKFENKQLFVLKKEYRNDEDNKENYW